MSMSILLHCLMDKNQPHIGGTTAQNLSVEATLDETLEDLHLVIDAIRDNLTALGIRSPAFERAVRDLLISLEELFDEDVDERSGNLSYQEDSTEPDG